MNGILSLCLFVFISFTNIGSTEFKKHISKQHNYSIEFPAYFSPKALQPTMDLNIQDAKGATIVVYVTKANETESIYTITKEEMEASMKAQYPFFKVHTINKVDINGCVALCIYTSPTKFLNQIFCMIEKNKKMYVINLGASAPDFEKYKTDFVKTINSFKIIK
jgi:hypothetical protein